jgi:hypothetical protein
MQEKDSSVITAHQSTKRLTLALGIFKLRQITWQRLVAVYDWLNEYFCYPNLQQLSALL